MTTEISRGKGNKIRQATKRVKKEKYRLSIYRWENSGAVENDAFCSTARKSASFVFLNILRGRNSCVYFPQTLCALSAKFL